MKILILLISLLSSKLVFAENNYDYLLSIINNELSEVSRLNKQINASDDNLILRMAELYLERGRVKKEKENENFLSIPSSQRRKINKKKYFKASKQDMLKANRLGAFILKKFKNTELKGDIFYIFAFYAQEYQTIKKAKKYFNLAKKYGKKDSSSFKKSSLALGDIFYNEKKFKQAILNYENAIDDKESKWWTRDAYNLAWCYFREGRKAQGVNLMKEVFRLSKKGFYLNFQKESQRDLIYFFVDSGKVNEAERFIRKNGEDPNQLVKLAKNLIDQGKGSKAIFFLEKAKKSINNDADIVEVNNLLLDLYDKFGSIKDHLEVAKSQHGLFLKKELDEVYIKSLEYHLKKMTASIQEKIKSRRYKTNSKLEAELSNQHREYVFIIHDVLKKIASNYDFFQGEIDYAIGRFEIAATSYFKVLNNKSRRIKKTKILSNLLACISNLDNNSVFYEKNAQKIYESFVSTERDQNKKKSIYPLLFSLYLKKGLVEHAEKILSGYNKTYKKDMKTIESMLANLLEHPSIKNNKVRFLGYVNKINKKELIISKKLASAIRNNALNLQFKGVQRESKDGKKANALRGYKLIYDDKLSSVEAKKNAAFNLAVLFYELKYPKKTAAWLLNSIALMKKKDGLKLFNQLRKMSLDLYNQGEEGSALKLMIKIGNLTCNDSADFRSLASDYFNLYLIEGKAPRLSTAKFLSCVKKKYFREELIIKSYDSFFVNGDIDFLFKQLVMTLRIKNLQSDKELEMAKMVALSYFERSPRKAKKIIQLVNAKYKKTRSNNLYYKELSALSRFYDLKKRAGAIFYKKLSFPENLFNSRLKKRINDLSSLSADVVNDLKKGGVLFVAPMYKLLINSYQRLAREITGVSPPKKSKEYVSAFRKSMSDLSNSLNKQESELRLNLKNIIVKKEILSLFNIEVSNELPHGDIPVLDINYWITSDRGL